MDNLQEASERFSKKAWPLTDVLKKLIEASDILLKRKSYDGHGYEEIIHAQKSARDMLAELEANASSEDAPRASEFMPGVNITHRLKMKPKF